MSASFQLYLHELTSTSSSWNCSDFYYCFRTLLEKSNVCLLMTTYPNISRHNFAWDELAFSVISFRLMVLTVSFGDICLQRPCRNVWTCPDGQIHDHILEQCSIFMCFQAVDTVSRSLRLPQWLDKGSDTSPENRAAGEVWKGLDPVLAASLNSPLSLQDRFNLAFKEIWASCHFLCINACS